MPAPSDPNQAKANYPPPYPYQTQPQPPLPAAPNPVPSVAEARYYIPADDLTYVSPSVSIPGHNEPKLFNSLWVRPQEKVYENLEADEVVLMVITRHWVTQIPAILLGGLFAVMPLILVPIALIFLSGGYFIRLLLVLSWFWYTWVFLYFIGTLIRWKSDIYLVTTERIIDFESDLLLLKSAKDYELEYIYQVDHSKPQGLIKGGIPYGTVEAKFPAEEGGVRMRNIPQPEKIALAIGEIAELARRQKAQEGGGH